MRYTGDTPTVVKGAFADRSKVGVVLQKGRSPIQFPGGS
jgi:hypothetical protein